MHFNLATLGRRARFDARTIKGAKGEEPARNGRIAHFSEVYQCTACEEARSELGLA